MTRAEARARNLEIQRRATAGESYVELAKAFGLSVPRIEVIARRRVHTRGPAKVQLLRERILELYAAGASHREIAEKLGISAPHSSRVCIAAGVSRGSKR